MVTLQATQWDSSLRTGVLLGVNAAVNSAGDGRRWGAGHGRCRSGHACREGDGQAVGGVSVADHRTVVLLGLLLSQTLDLSFTGLRQTFDGLVLVLLRLLRRLQASLSGSFLPFLHHFCRHFLFLITHGQLQQRLRLLFMEESFLEDTHTQGLDH